ncbi:MAG: GNAT family N-acetyltransferase [Dehalococcoidia bacterium]
MLVRLYALPEEEGGVLERLSAAGIECRRAESYERQAVLQFVQERWPNWVDEAVAGFAHVPPTVYIARRGRAVLGFGCYNATRPDYFGPTGVDESERGAGIGRAILRLCLEALAAEGYAYAIIGGVDGRESFYEEAAGATVIGASVPGIYGGMVRAPTT